MSGRHGHKKYREPERCVVCAMEKAEKLGYVVRIKEKKP